MKSIKTKKTILIVATIALLIGLLIYIVIAADKKAAEESRQKSYNLYYPIVGELLNTAYDAPNCKKAGLSKMDYKITNFSKSGKDGYVAWIEVNCTCDSKEFDSDETLVSLVGWEVQEPFFLKQSETTLDNGKSVTTIYNNPKKGYDHECTVTVKVNGRIAKAPNLCSREIIPRLWYKPLVAIAAIP